MDLASGGHVEKLLLTVEQAEEVTEICRSKLYEFMAAGALRSVKIGRSRRIARVDLETFVERIRAEQAPAELTAA